MPVRWWRRLADICCSVPHSPLIISEGIFWGFRGSHIQKSVEAVKRLDRLAPNLAHMCRFIWEWIYAKQIALRDTRGALGGGGGLGGQTFKSLEKLSNGCTDWHQLWFRSEDSSGNRHRLNTSHPTIPQGHFGVFRGSQIQMSGEAVKLLDRLATNLVYVCGFVWELTWLNTIRPSISQGAFRGVSGGHKFKSGKAAKRMDR